MKHILIIEDERAVAELERDYLEINSFKVSIEETGEGGLQRALKGDIDLIILDLMLPDMDGFEICRELRHRIDIPILIVSAKKSDIDKIRGLVCIPSSRQLKKYKIFVLPGVYGATFLCRQSLLFMKFHWC